MIENFKKKSEIILKHFFTCTVNSLPLMDLQFAELPFAVVKIALHKEQNKEHNALFTKNRMNFHWINSFIPVKKLFYIFIFLLREKFYNCKVQTLLVTVLKPDHPWTKIFLFSQAIQMRWQLYRFMQGWTYFFHEPLFMNEIQNLRGGVAIALANGIEFLVRVTDVFGQPAWEGIHA